MKIKIGIVIGLLYGAGFGYGDLIEPISVNRSISVSGIVTNESGVTRSFSDSQQTGNVSGVVDASDPVIAWPAPGSQHAEASATQESPITSDGISNSGRLFAQTWVPFGGPPFGTSSAFAGSIFEITFRVLEVLDYQLDVHRDFFQDFGFPDLEFRLSGLTNGAVIPGLSAFDGHWAGMLLPDEYTLTMNEHVSASVDPFGDIGECNYNMALRVTSVPEGGSSLWMMSAGLGALAVYGRKLA